MAVSLSVALAGCMPSGGPSSQSVVTTASNRATPYVLVKLSGDVVARLGGENREGLANRFSGRGPGKSPHIMLGVGDVVSVTIFEAAAGGLFIPASSGARPGNYVTLPDQNVDNQGNITMPYAGSIRAAGRSIPTVQADIVSRLKDRAIEPQVVITLKDQLASQVSVLGAVRQAARFPINPSGDRLLDVIAKAGGPEFPAYETYVTVQRGGREGTEHFSRLVDHPEDNIYVIGGDMVVLSRKPKSFVALGASGKNGQFNFEDETVTLSEAIGKAGGLLDARANPSYVFLYRLEDRPTLARIGYGNTNVPGEVVPTIYMADLRSPEGYFLASKFELRDKDVLYIANAPSVDVSKVFSFVTFGAVAGRQVGLVQ
jgi:polysaccharide export outer membrane protein